MVRETKYGSYITLQVQNSATLTQKPLTNGGQKQLKIAPKRDFHHFSILTKSEMEARMTSFS